MSLNTKWAVMVCNSLNKPAIIPNAEILFLWIWFKLADYSYYEWLIIDLLTYN